MTSERECAYSCCHVIFSPRRGNQKYCSYDCYIDVKNERRRESRELDPEGKRQYDFEWRRKNRSQHLQQKKVYQKKIRQMVHEIYGSKCVWCGQTYEAILCLDHINNDGAKERKRRSHKATHFHIWEDFKKTGEWRKDIQILCISCNWAKAYNGGILPPELKNQFQRNNPVPIIKQTAFVGDT